MQSTTTRLPTTHPAHDATARAVGVVGFAAIALIHVLDLPAKLEETPWLGVAYILLIAGMIVAGFDLIRGATRRGWMMGGALAVFTGAGYAVNRTWGLPGATDDIGNWLEPIGLASLFVEASVALLAGWALAVPQPGADG